MSINSRAAREFFRVQVGDLSAATRAVLRASARELKANMTRQMRRNFKRGSNSNGSFFKGFKIYDLNADASRGPVSYVRQGVPFLEVFEDGATIRPKNGNKYIIILLSSGADLGFKRITKGNSWNRVWDKFKKNFKLINRSDGILVLYSFRGRVTPVYKFVREVRIKKRLNFYKAAEQIADKMPDEIRKLLT